MSTRAFSYQMTCWHTCVVIDDTEEENGNKGLNNIFVSQVKIFVLQYFSDPESLKWMDEVPISKIIFNRKESIIFKLQMWNIYM